MWDQIHPEISDAARSIAETGKFDDAIFAAFRHVEAKIQDRIGSTQIGESLIAEAFDGTPPSIHISIDQRDQRGIRNIFSGALANIRNDRGHKKAPLLPCVNLADCRLYLSVASFLLYLLTKDTNIFPSITSLRVFGTDQNPRAELRGANFIGADASVTTGTVRHTIVRLTPSALEIILPAHFFGEVTAFVDGNASNSVFCDVGALTRQPDNFYEVIAAELPLYEDSAGKRKRDGVVGLLLRANEGSHEFTRIVPTQPSRYRAGCYVSHGPYDPSVAVGESWYIDPDTSKVELAWNGSLLTTPAVLGPSGDFKLGGITILPKLARLQLKENRRLRVSARGRDGKIQKEFDVTNRVTWKTADESIAFVRNGVVIPKQLGKTSADCSLDGLAASVAISVEHIPRGAHTTYFQGLRRMQQIRFDGDDNLYVTNQGPSVYRLDRNGQFSEVIRISSNPMATAGIDCLAVDSNKNLYVNDVSKAAVFMFTWDGHAYVNPVEIATAVKGTKKAIAVGKSGSIYVAVMGTSPNQGWIVRRDLNGAERSFSIDGMPFSMAVSGTSEDIYIPFTTQRKICVYRPDGEKVREVPYAGRDFGVSDIAIGTDGSLYVPLFHGGKLLRFNISGSVEESDHGVSNPGGIAIDSLGRLYISDFGGNSIDVIY